MRKFVSVLFLMLAAVTMLTAQKKKNINVHQLYGVHYLNRVREYEGNTGYNNYIDSINNWGLGGTVFSGYGSIGFYSQTVLLIPTGHQYDPESSLGKQDLEGFRLGIDSISGVGFNFEITPDVGFLLGTGFHWDLIFMYKDLYYGMDGSEPSLTFDLGLGGAGDFYIKVSEQISIYIGGMAAWDFLVLQGNSYQNQHWDKATHWIYGFNAGIGFKL